ncbi:MAG TPA: R3H domain-containing nucleic acid-binding protein [Bacilli bacterium]|nr:R3H domain-containing nucleic acid-binding protein [Bacilli bacterium]
MKIYEAKTIELALEQASEDFGLPVEDIIYEFVEEKKRLFKKTVVINVHEVSDVIEYLSKYLVDIISAFDIEPTVKPSVEGALIRLEVDTTHNSILIGKNGRTLAAINQLVKLAATTHYKKRIRVLVDINDYKNQRYTKVISMAKRIAREVKKTHIDVTLDPMVADERRAVHNALSGYTNIATESVGERSDRRIVIKYTETE